MTTDLLLTQYQKSKLFNYNYYFSITFDSVKDKVVYYKILYGKSDDYFIDKKTSTNKIVITRYSILRLSNIQLDYFKSAMKNLYSKYFEYLEKLTDKQKTLPEEKKAFAIKSAIEKWLKEIIKSIDTILNNAQNDMIVSHLLNNMEKLELKTLRDTANELHLPYLDIINFDKNGQIIKYD